MGPILVFGHRTPTTTRVARRSPTRTFKNSPILQHLRAARLGATPRETAWCFEHFGVAVPEQIDHVRTRVRDVMTADPFTIGEAETMSPAGRIMREHGVRGLPVVDADGRSAGLISERVLAERYLDETEIAGFQRCP